MLLTTALLQPRNQSISQQKLYGINKRPICFTSMFYSTASLTRDLSLEMPADEKAQGALWLNACWWHH